MMKVARMDVMRPKEARREIRSLERVFQSRLAPRAATVVREGML